MMVKKKLVNVMLLASLFIGWASIAGAWTFDVDIYEYAGSGTLKGTKPGGIYIARGGAVTNNTDAQMELSVDLFYGDFFGGWQWSLNHGANWNNIDQGTTTWTRMVNSGQTITFRVVLFRPNNPTNSGIYHILSASPYGAADENLGDAYYYAFSPNSFYYSDFSTREVGITGYTAVIKN